MTSSSLERVIVIIIIYRVKSDQNRVAMIDPIWYNVVSELK